MNNTYDRDDLALLLPPRQAEIMRLFWNHGPATVRQVRQWLAKDGDLAYTTVATICVRLAERGLLQQRMEDAGCQDRQAYIYTPSTSEADFVRDAVTQQLDHLLAHYPELVAQYLQQAAAGGSGECAGDRAIVEHSLASPRDADDQRASDVALVSVAALIERAEAAERQAASWEAEAQRARQGEQSATARLEQAEMRAMEWEAAAYRATAQALLAEEDASVVIPRAALQGYGAARSAPEYYDLAGVCRVCNAPSPMCQHGAAMGCGSARMSRASGRRVGETMRPSSAGCARRRREREHERALAR